jgi:hypothetical protein
MLRVTMKVVRKRRWICAPSVMGAAIAVAVAFGFNGIGRCQDRSATNAVPALQLDTNAPVKVVQPTQIDLPPALAEVVRLAQSGAEESVIVAYVQKSPPYRVSSDQIIYLQDLGISQGVIKALVEHSPGGAEAAAAAVPAAPEPTPVTTNAPGAAPVTEAQAPSQTNVATVDYFYQTLAPYGTWVDVPSYGVCWQPTVVIVNPGWRPYCDNGYWLWSDQGWYWRSYYSWGWAPFHYGRWFYHPYRGWIWWPDPVWGPSWVCWRSGSAYYGWAPLPPRTYFNAGVGWTFNGVAVGFNFGFGLGASYYTFVPPTYFTSRQIAVHALPPRQVNTVFNNTTVINNYTVGSNNRIINQGIDRRHIETVTRTPLPEVKVRELPRQPTGFAVPDRVARVGRADVIYRPSSQMTVPPMPRTPRTVTPPPGTYRAPGPAPPPAPTEPRQVPRAQPVQPVPQGPPARAYPEAPRRPAPEQQPRSSITIGNRHASPEVQLQTG